MWRIFNCSQKLCFRNVVRPLTTESKTPALVEELIRQTARDIQAEFKESDGRMSSRFDKVDIQFKEINARQRKMDRGLTSMGQSIGNLVEGHGRSLARKFVGDEYVKGLLAQSLVDLTEMLPNEFFWDEARASKSVKISRDVSSKILALKVPEQLLECASKKLKVPEPWVVDNKVNNAALGAYIAACPDKSVQRSLTSLRDVITLESDEERIEALERRNSAGIMCLIAAAHPSRYLSSTTYPKFLFPPESLEFDFRGRLDVTQRGRFATIDTGEVKTQLEYAKGIEQLGIRLGTLRWFVSSIVPDLEAERVHLLGRLFIPARKMSEADIEKVKEARDVWRYDLFLHF